MKYILSLFSTVPVYFIWLKYLSWIGYANEILNVNQWEGVKFDDCRENATCFHTGEQYLETISMEKVYKNIRLKYSKFFYIKIIRNM